MVAALCVATTAGCSSTTDAGDLDEVETHIDVPEFTGPWAADFADAYRRAQSSVHRAMLADGEISDLEYAAVRDEFSRCLADVGYAVTWHDRGGYSLQVTSDGVDPDHVNEIVADCSRSTLGDVDFLYQQMARNPQNLDEFVIVADCLVHEGVVDPSFTAEDYQEWFDSTTDVDLPYTVSASEGQGAFSQCTSDPLGLLG
jgi:uncharacterized protein (DUF885 family)